MMCTRRDLSCVRVFEIRLQFLAISTDSGVCSFYARSRHPHDSLSNSIYSQKILLGPHFQQHPHANAKDAGSGLAAELTSKGLFGMLFRPANNPVVYYN